MEKNVNGTKKYLLAFYFLKYHFPEHIHANIAYRHNQEQFVKGWRDLLYTNQFFYILIAPTWKKF